MIGQSASSAGRAYARQHNRRTRHGVHDCSNEAPIRGPGPGILADLPSGELASGSHKCIPVQHEMRRQRLDHCATQMQVPRATGRRSRARLRSRAVTGSQHHPGYCNFEEPHLPFEEARRALPRRRHRLRRAAPRRCPRGEPRPAWQRFSESRRCGADPLGKGHAGPGCMAESCGALAPRASGRVQPGANAAIGYVYTTGRLLMGFGCARAQARHGLADARGADERVHPRLTLIADRDRLGRWRPRA